MAQLFSNCLFSNRKCHLISVVTNILAHFKLLSLAVNARSSWEDPNLEDDGHIVGRVSFFDALPSSNPSEVVVSVSCRAVVSISLAQ